MKKSLLLSGALLLATGIASASTDFYPASDEMLGEVTGVSANGRWAVIDDSEMNLSYLWDSEDPVAYTQIPAAPYEKIDVYGVSDDCTIVGTVYKGNGKWRPAYRKGLEGEWVELDVDPATLNTAEAVAISPDNKYIAGYMMVKGDGDGEGPMAGAYYPGQWTLNDAGEYDFKLFYDFDTFGQQGFLISCQSHDGRILGGYIHAGNSDAYLPAMIKDGKFVMFDTVETKMEPWYYKDKYMGEEEVSYIDGFKDDRSDYTFVGAFHSIDQFGNLYGRRTTVEDVTEQGGGTLVFQAAVYNVETEEWYYNEEAGAFSCGYDQKIMFASDAKIMKDHGPLAPIKTALNFGKDFGETLTAVTHMSDDTMTLGGTYQILNPAIGAYQYYPFMLMLDEPLVELSGIEVIEGETPVAVVISRGRIDFAGAEGFVYDLNGRSVGQGSSVSVAPGTYIVKAGNQSRTVIVK